jgi:hypothetical protein
MALTASPSSSLNALIYKTTDLNSTPVVDISALPGDGTSHYLEQVIVVNTTGGAGDVYVKLYDTKAPTVGTTDPDLVLFVKAATTSSLLIPDGLPFAAGISSCAVTAGGTGGTANPAAAVTVTYVVRTA